jgi:hypothetical protein
MTWTKNFTFFLKLGHDMKITKTCFDCLHCKVSKKSTEKCRLCFCSETKNKGKHKEIYWLKKPVCRHFEDMTA